MDGEDLRTKPYQRRFVKLSNLLNRPDITHIEFVKQQPIPPTKSACSVICKPRERKVLCSSDWMPHTHQADQQRRQPAQAQVLRHLFCRGRQDQRQAERRTALLNCKGWVSVGNVTIPPNFKCRRWVM